MREGTWVEACGTDDVEPGLALLAPVVQEHHRADDGEDRDRGVHEQAPPPAQVLGEKSTEDQADGAATTGDGTVYAERPSPLVRLGEGDGDQGQGSRRQDGGEDPLEPPRGEQHASARRGTTEGGGTGEPDEPDDQGTSAPDQVTDATAEQEEPAERERVGGDDPLPVGVRDAQVGLGRRQGDVHDGHVQHHHELCESDDTETPPTAGIGSVDGGGDGRPGRGHGRVHRRTFLEKGGAAALEVRPGAPFMRRDVGPTCLPAGKLYS